MSIEVEGVRYKVVENLGFNHSIGKYGKIIDTPDGDRVVVKYPGGLWKFPPGPVSIMRLIAEGQTYE